MSLMVFDNTIWQKVACGRYGHKEKRENNDMSLFVHTIDLEEGACGRYNNKQKSMDSIMNGLVKSSHQ